MKYLLKKRLIINNFKKFVGIKTYSFLTLIYTFISPRNFMIYKLKIIF